MQFSKKNLSSIERKTTATGTTGKRYWFTAWLTKSQRAPPFSLFITRLSREKKRRENKQPQNSRTGWETSLNKWGGKFHYLWGRKSANSLERYFCYCRNFVVGAGNRSAAIGSFLKDIYFRCLLGNGTLPLKSVRRKGILIETWYFVSVCVWRWGASLITK